LFDCHPHFAIRSRQLKPVSSSVDKPRIALPAEWRLRTMQKSNAASLTSYLTAQPQSQGGFAVNVCDICKAKHQNLCL
jgi:hypothetical protein